MTIKNKKIASIYYFIIFIVLCYVVGYTIILSKGYQAADTVSGTTTVKIKGSGAIGNETAGTLLPMDAMDLVVPSTENSAFFITTVLLIDWHHDAPSRCTLISIFCEMTGHQHDAQSNSNTL